MSPHRSPFAIRGVIEGFYGNPWTHDERLAMVDFLADHGFNTFVYAPKDDPLVRRLWREAYAGGDLARLAELVARCERRGISLVYCVSPGLSIRYASQADQEALAAKLRSVGTLGESGVRSFGLLLDDIPRELQHPEDRAAFPDLAAAHARLASGLLARLGAGTSLTVCPTIYCGTGVDPYLAALGAALDPRIDLFWSGRAICSPTLEAADARVFAATTGRPPLYWDNYPVNDVAMTFELHVGPYRGRDAQLGEVARGIIANPMELAMSSRIPLATIGAYLRDPVGYDPEAAWQDAIREVAGVTDHDAYALFADNVRSSCLATDDAPVVAAALERFLFRVEHGDEAGAAVDLAALADQLLAAADRLLRGPVANPPLIEEGRPWIEAFETGARAMRRMADLAAAGRLEADARAELHPYLVALRRARVRIFGDALDMTLDDLTDTHVRPGRLTEPEGDAAR